MFIWLLRAAVFSTKPLSGFRTTASSLALTGVTLKTEYQTISSIYSTQTKTPSMRSVLTNTTASGYHNCLYFDSKSDLMLKYASVEYHDPIIFCTPSNESIMDAQVKVDHEYDVYIGSFYTRDHTNTTIVTGNITYDADFFLDEKKALVSTSLFISHFDSITPEMTYHDSFGNTQCIVNSRQNFTLICTAADASQGVTIEVHEYSNFQKKGGANLYRTIESPYSFKALNETEIFCLGSIDSLPLIDNGVDSSSDTFDNDPAGNIKGGGTASNAGIIAGAICGCLLLLIVIVIISYIVLRQRKNRRVRGEEISGEFSVGHNG